MDNIKHLVWLASAGLSGAFIGLTMHPGERTKLQRLMFLVSGLLVAFWLAPFICKYFHLDEPEEISAVAFAAGAFWSSIVEKLGAIVKAMQLGQKGSGKDV